MRHFFICRLLGFRWDWIQTVSDTDSNRRKNRIDTALYRCSRCRKIKVRAFTRKLR